MSAFPTRGSIALAFLAWVAPMGAARAAASDEADPPGWIEASARTLHGALERRFGAGVDLLDGFFGTELEDETAQTSRLRVTVDTTWSEGGEIELSGAARASLALPRAERRLFLVVDAVEDRLWTSGDGGDGGEETGPRSSFAGLRRTLFQRADTWVNLRGGLRMSLDLKPMISLYAQHRQELGTWRLTASQSAYWRRLEGFGETTRLDIDRALGPAWAGRATSRATWSETSRGVELSQTLSFARPLGERHRFGIEGGVEGYTRPGRRIDRSFARIRLRRRLRWQAVSVEVAPEAVFPEENGYRFSPRCVFRVEVLFDAPERTASPPARANGPGA